MLEVGWLLCCFQLVGKKKREYDGGIFVVLRVLVQSAYNFYSCFISKNLVIWLFNCWVVICLVSFFIMEEGIIYFVGYQEILVILFLIYFFKEGEIEVYKGKMIYFYYEVSWEVLKVFSYLFSQFSIYLLSVY